MKNYYRPLKNNVLVKPILVCKKTSASGLIVELGSRDTNKTDTGIIIGISKSLKDRDLIGIGEQVHYGKFSGVKVWYDNEEFLLLEEKELLVSSTEEDIKILYSPEIDAIQESGELNYLKHTDKNQTIEY